MKFRTMLLASAAVMFTSSAFAADITNPFFLPTTGKVLSDTSIEMSRAKADDGVFEDVDKNLVARETLTVGLTDNLAVFGSLTNNFDVNEEYNNDHNFDYELGVKYNHNFGRVLTQAGLSYWTMDPQSFYGQNYMGDNSGRWVKVINASVKVGYDMGCDFTPYTSFSMQGEIDNADRSQAYSWFVGAHKMYNKVAVDAGLRYDFGDYSKYDLSNDDGHAEDLYLQLAADYYVRDNMTVGLYGEYNVLPEDKDTDYDYTVGLSAKVLF